jgi:hypothetical protein
MTFYDFLSGAVAFGFVVCGLFFLSYWRRSREELYLTFALAFAILGLGQAILSLGNIPNEERGSLYLFRLTAFILILVAIYRKNRAARR